MSKNANRKLSFLKLLVHRVRGVALTYSGESLTPTDTDTTHVALAMWLAVLCDILQDCESPRGDYQCTTGRILSDWCTRGLDVKLLVCELSSIDELLINLSSRDQLPRFKHEIRRLRLSNHWLVGACTDILATSVEPIHMCAKLHQFFRFPVRLRLTGIEELKRVTESKYFDNLTRVSQHNTSTDLEQAIIAKWFECYEYPTVSDLGYGNGATSLIPVKSIEEKYTFSGDIARTRILAHRLGIDPDPVLLVRAPQSRLIFVPKSAKIMRPIAAEDPSLMFYQQGILKSLDRLFRSTDLRRRINLHNQTRSRTLARCGSGRPTSYATIDLSSASDSVKTELVEKWFARTPLNRVLPLCRSTHAKYKDEIISLPMFASMGSAICFPIECICFAAQCAATILSLGDSPDRSNFCVYGDDIIIESKYAPALIERLEYNGFLVNKDKSFYDDTMYFRESCGGEYLHGVDITPLHLSRRFSSDLKSRPQMMSAMIVLANASFARNLVLLRMLVIQLIKEWYSNKVLYSDDTDLISAQYLFGQFEETVTGRAIFSPQATNYHVESRYNRRYQRREYRVLGSIPKVEQKKRYEVGRYLFTLHKPDNQPEASEPRGAVRCTARTRLALRLSWRTAT